MRYAFDFCEFSDEVSKAGRHRDEKLEARKEISARRDCVISVRCGWLPLATRECQQAFQTRTARKDEHAARNIGSAAIRHALKAVPIYFTFRGWAGTRYANA